MASSVNIENENMKSYLVQYSFDLDDNLGRDTAYIGLNARSVNEVKEILKENVDKENIKVEQIVELKGERLYKGKPETAIWNLKGEPGPVGPQGPQGPPGGLLFPTMDFDPETGELVISGLEQEVDRIDFDEDTAELIIRLAY